MPSMTGTGVLQVLSLKQIFPCLRLEMLSELYLLDFSDGLAPSANFICPGGPTTSSTTSEIIEFILLFR